MRGPKRLLPFLLACASSVIASGQSQMPTKPEPSTEVEKLAVMVGRFKVEDELKAGVIRPNSPAMKYTGIDDCRWAAGGFALICTAVLHMGTKKYTETSFIYYDP